MACGSCGKRGVIISTAAKRIVQGKSIAPLARAFGRTVSNDVARVIKPALPRFTKR